MRLPYAVWLLLLAALPSLASPIASISGSEPVSIPITKRTPFASRATSAEDRLAILHAGVDGLYSKYGLEYPPSGMKRRQAVVELADYDGDISYYGVVTIGSQGLAYPLIFDTGSSDLVVASSSCVSGCLSTTPLYHPPSSSTSGVSNNSFSILYGTGSASGVLVRDQVSIGGFTIKHQIFAACTNLTRILSGDVSGLLGLGWQSIANSNAVPLVQALWNAKVLPSPVFGFGFARWIHDSSAYETVLPGGQMTIGGVNNSLYDGSLNYINITAKRFWGIPLDDISIGGVPLSISTEEVVIDTGTSLIGVPRAAANAIYSQIAGAFRIDSNFYAFPCSTDVFISFTFGGVKYDVDPRDFNNGYADSTRTSCIGAIFSIVSGSQTDRWIFGDAFLKNVYTAFRFSPASVGFAPLKPHANLLLQSGSVPRSNQSVSNSNVGASTTPGVTSGALRSLKTGLGNVVVTGIVLALTM